MNVGVHERPQGIEDHAMPFQRPASLEMGRHYRDFEVSSTIRGTCVPRMQMTLVFDLQFRRPENLVEPRFNKSDPVCVHGRTLRNGLTITWL